MTANELQGLLATLDQTVSALELDDPLDADAVAKALKPQRDVVREAYLRAVRVEAMAAE